MDRLIRKSRHAAIIAVSASSIAIGLALVWTLVRPGVAAALETWQLVFMLGLVFLPAAAFCAWDVERRSR